MLFALTILTISAPFSPSHLKQANLFVTFGQALLNRTQSQDTPRETKALSKRQLQTQSVPEPKSCAFVANTPHFPMGMANEIDNHDIVVRFNDFWKKRFWANPERAWGSKTNVVVLNDQKHVLPSELDQLIGTSWRCYIRSEHMIDRWAHGNFKINHSLETLKTFRKRCTFITAAMWDAAVKQIQQVEPSYQGIVSPTTGFLGIMTLMQNCTSMKFYGFNTTPTHYWSHHRYLAEHAVVQQWIDNPRDLS